MRVALDNMKISIHALLAESDSTVDSCSVCSSISIHALLAESDRSSVKWQFIRYIFLSTLSLRRATKRYFIYFIGRLLFLSTLSLRRATRLSVKWQFKRYIFLSTLSLRRATPKLTAWSQAQTFLSTLSLRRATGYLKKGTICALNFYPRSPCGERRIPSGGTGGADAFLSTLSLRRATAITFKRAYTQRIFLSTLSLRRATASPTILTHRVKIFLSTLSLRRATRGFGAFCTGRLYFYPRSPCGERLDGRVTLPPHQQFLSTLSLRRATANTWWDNTNGLISIHALLAESDAQP